MLDYAWDAHEFTTADAMDSTGLTRSTTIEALERLISLGLLRELPNAREVGQYRKGRPARRFELRADAAVVVGVDAGRSRMTCVVADLRGRELARRSQCTGDEPDDPQARRLAIDALVVSVLAQAHSSRDDVMAVCAGVPAAVDCDGLSPTHVDGFWQVMNPDLRELFEGWAPIVRIENDASLAAIAEGAVGAATGSSDFVALIAGVRLGIGVVVDGHPLRGARGAAGEAVGFRWVTGVESESGFGSRITDWAVEAVGAGELPDGHRLTGATRDQLAAEVVLDLAADGDAWAASLVERAGGVLARIAAVLASMYDPEQIVVAGAVAQKLGPVIDIANRELPGHLDGPAPVLLASQLGAAVVVTGAVMGAVQAARRGVLAAERTFG